MAEQHGGELVLTAPTIDVTHALDAAGLDKVYVVTPANQLEFQAARNRLHATEPIVGSLLAQDRIETTKAVGGMRRSP